MNLSYWEYDQWLKDLDHAVVGGGIVGLSCALHLRKRFPKSKIAVFEKGVLPTGASTRNAGFACFGSVSEILDDLDNHSEEEVIEIINSRISGLNLLRETLGDELMNYEQNGGYEVFLDSDTELYEKCMDNLNKVNDLLHNTLLHKKDAFLAKNDPFSFKNSKKQLIFNQYEGQLHPGKMVDGLIKKAQKEEILILNSTEITSFSPEMNKIRLKTRNFESIFVRSLCIATNGFAKDLVDDEIQPARAQVLITHPIPGLNICGTFHLDRGYYYFRNYENRILLGGGRNLDFEKEETSQFGLTDTIQNKLDHLLRTTILPDIPFTIDRRWSGIMGIGPKKKPIVKKLCDGVYCGIRLGGMGVAIGSTVGKRMADLVES